MQTNSQIVCQKCGEPQDANAFGKRNGIRNKRCKKCCAAAVRETYAKSIEYRQTTKSRHTRVSLQNQVFIFQYLLAHPCIDCGENDPVVLEFDHLIPEEKQYNITAMLLWSRERIIEEIGQCVVRCANCHRRKTAKERNSVRYQLSQHSEIPEISTLLSQPIERIDRRRLPKPRKVPTQIDCSFCGTSFIATHRKLKKVRAGRSAYCNVTCSNRSKLRRDLSVTG